MAILKLTREEIIEDHPRAFREHNDIGAMDNKKLIASWRRHGNNAGTWDWDYVVVVNES